MFNLNNIDFRGVIQPVAVTPVNNAQDASGEGQCITPGCNRDHGEGAHSYKLKKAGAVIVAAGVIYFAAKALS